MNKDTIVKAIKVCLSRYDLVAECVEVIGYKEEDDFIDTVVVTCDMVNDYPEDLTNLKTALEYFEEKYNKSIVNKYLDL